MPPDPRPLSAPCRPALRGFSLVGLAVILAALSVLAAVAVPLLQDRMRAAKAAETTRLFTSFARSFAAAAKAAGDWPAAPAVPGELPPGPGLETAGEAWRRPSPIGGHFQWVAHSAQAGTRIRAGITISSTPAGAVSTDRALLTAIDTAIDDGNLATGKFRLGYRAQPLLILEP